MDLKPLSAAPVDVIQIPLTRVRRALREVEGRILFCEYPAGYTVEIVQMPKS